MANMRLTITKKNHHLFFFLLFFFASICIFIFQNRENSFGSDHRGQTSSIAAALSKSLIVEDSHLVMLINKQLLKNGEVCYHPYNRFPVFEYLIVGAAMQIFEPDLAMQIYIARQVMNVFLLTALLLCFVVVNEILSDRFLSLTVTLSVFSSYYILYYNDMISNMSTPLCGFVLALLMVIKSRKGNLRKLSLILFPILSVSTGWQSYAVFITWFLVDTIQQVREKKGIGNIIKIVVSQQSFIAITLSIIVGFLILGIQMMNEWMITGGSFQEIPTIHSFQRRLGMDQSALESNNSPYNDLYHFLILQAFRILIMIVPFAGIIISKVASSDLTSLIPGFLFALVGGALFVHGIMLFRNRMDVTVVSIFVLSGFAWAVPMRHYVTWHAHQSVFYIGFAIIFFIVLSFYIKQALSRVLAVMVCLLFILSIYHMNAIKSTDEKRLNAITSDFISIYSMLPKNSKVYVDCAGRFGKDERGMDFCRNEVSADLGLGGQSLDFYLVGHYRVFLENADYVISRNSNYNQERLTTNPIINLFKKTIAHGP